MKNNMKKRLAIFLSIMLVLPTIMQVLPMMSTEVSAAQTVYMSTRLFGDPSFIEVGEKFNFGDYILIYVYGAKKSTSYIASDVKVKYKSSDKSVVTITNKGVCTTVGEGTAVITATYKGKSIKNKITVVPADTYTETEVLKTLESKANAIAKATPKKITTKNVNKCYKLLAEYKNYVSEHSAEISDRGAVNNQSVTIGNTTYRGGWCIAVPQAGAYVKLSEKLNDFASGSYPLSTRSSKQLKVKSVKAKANTITVKLNKKADASQIVSMKIYDYMFGSEKLPATKAYAIGRIYDAKTNEYYIGRLEFKKGSNTAKITKVVQYSKETYGYVDVKLKKGRTYKLGSGKKDWGYGKKFTVK